MNIILTAYFNSLPDPQRKEHWMGNDITIFRDLYKSVRKLGLTMKVFHDNLNSNFISKYSLGGISYIRYEPTEDILNARWRCYYDYISRTNFKKYLCLDCSDTELYKDPFPLIEMDRVVIGSEMQYIGKMPWMVKWCERAYGEVIYPEMQILNCGILGGSRDVMLAVLERFIEELSVMERTDEVDMAIFNKIIREFEYKTGYPMHTRLGKFEKNECYIRHK